MMAQNDKKQDHTMEVRGKGRQLDRYALGIIGLGIGLIILSIFLFKEVVFYAGWITALLGLFIHSRLRRSLLIIISVAFWIWTSLGFGVSETDISFGVLWLGFLWGTAVLLIIWRVPIKTVITVTVLLGFFSTLPLPSYFHYSKRSRTSESFDHARLICEAVTQWTSRVEGAEGGFKVSAPHHWKHNGLSFHDKFSDEGNWLENGDRFYQFMVHLDGPHGSSLDNPVVLASPKKGQKKSRLYAGIIQAGGTGVETGDDLSGCKGSVEKVSDRY